MAVTPTYVPLATVTATGSETSYVFSSIPAGYRDLIAVVNGGTTSANATLFVRLNSDSGSNYSMVVMAGNTNPPFSGAGTGTGFVPHRDFAFTRVDTGYRNAYKIQILDSSATDKHKSILSNGGYVNPINSDSVPMAVAGRWANTAAVNTVSFVLSANTFATGTTISIYGVN